ncbi:hypothetical protein B0A55_08715 [Friedmanniomyces simplex]|uniref:Ubiquitin-like domain-containing protein n=1 Tax=Friedmanniomyces simplex TaxID=329884 RepID=A0A4U0X256_9PEZI|nr:hypothetical protein B0A55_08715 [Friedmanniomyces simplex]
MATANSDQDMMAALGAKLMGISIASPPRATHSATAPRSVPATTTSINTDNVPLFARPVPPEVRITPPVTRAESAFTIKPTSTTSASSTTSTPVLTERKLNVPDTVSVSSSKSGSATLETTRGSQTTTPLHTERKMDVPVTNSNPLRKGDPVALKEAREFSQSVANGKVLQPHARKSTSGTRRNPVAATPTGWQGFASTASLHGKSATTSTTPTSTKPTATSTTPTSNPFAAQREKATVITDTAAATAPVVTEVKPSPPENKEKPTGLLGRQMADVKNTLNGLTHTLPPHLRAKAAAEASKSSLSAEPSIMSPAKVNTSKPVGGTEVKKASDVAVKSSAETTKVTPASRPAPASSSAAYPAVEQDAKVKAGIITPIPASNSTSATSNLAKPAVDDKPKQDTATSTPVTTDAAQSVVPDKPKLIAAPVPAQKDGTQANPISIDSSHCAKSSGSSTCIMGDVAVGVIVNLRRDIDALIKRVNASEQAHLDDTLKLEEMVMAEHRRKFLGTDSAEVPYKVFLTYADGKIIAIQADRQTRVHSLIRSARALAQLTPSEMQNPRLIFNGMQVGHSVLLGEVGILAGADLALTWGGAEEP